MYTYTHTYIYIYIYIYVYTTYIYIYKHIYIYIHIVGSMPTRATIPECEPLTLRWCGLTSGQLTVELVR